MNKGKAINFANIFSKYFKFYNLKVIFLISNDFLNKKTLSKWKFLKQIILEQSESSKFI